MRNIKYSIYSLLLLLSLLFSCNNASDTAIEASKTEDRHEDEHGSASETAVELTEEQYRIAGIELGKPEPKNLSSSIPVNGVLDVPPQNLVTISAPLGGFVKNTEMLQGMRVKKGQLIAVIENPEFIQIQQEYLESRSRLEYLELEFKRQQELAAENVTAAKTFQQTTAEYKSIRSRVSALTERLSLIGINTKQLQDGTIRRTVNMYAPINGYVTEVNVNIGKYVNPTDVLFEIVDTEHLHVELTVYEKDVTKLRKGQKIRFTLPNESGKERRATLYLIGREISADRTIRVHAHMDDEDTQLIPGMYVKAQIEADTHSVPALPEEAFVQSEGKNYVFLFKGKRKEGEAQMSDFEMVEVQKGVSESGYAQVDLPQDDTNQETRIAIKGAYSLLAKLKNTEKEGEGHAH